MRDIYNYATSTWKGVLRFSCLDCPFDVLKNETTILEHCKRFKHGIDLFGGVSTEEWVQEQQPLEPRSKGVLLGQISWNTKQATAEAAHALFQEASRLFTLGNWASVVITDNGSHDGTVEAISKVVAELGSMPKDCSFRGNWNPRNHGISHARNQIIDICLQDVRPWSYILFTDGDIEVVPYSSYVMLRYLECHPKLGVIGAYSSNYTIHREKASPRFLEITESRVKDDIKVAWTQYGLFRVEMFRQGLRFDESGPFGEPGWGFEDDDFYFQMMEKGWGNKYFGGMTYLHRNIRSSWPNMEAQGLDPNAIFYKRKDYVIEKWCKRGLNSSILRALEAQHPPRRPDATK